MELFAETLEAGRVTPAAAHRFRRHLYRFFHDQGRQLPWRATTDPYHILVSEIMLQQTQVERVALKYEPFIHCLSRRFIPGPGPLAGHHGQVAGAGV